MLGEEFEGSVTLLKQWKHRTLNLKPKGDGWAGRKAVQQQKTCGLI